MWGFHFLPSQCQIERLAADRSRDAKDLSKKRAQFSFVANKAQRRMRDRLRESWQLRLGHALALLDHLDNRDLRVAKRVRAVVQEQLMGHLHRICVNH
jgi:hypothetical protein